ncbi:LOW QUALITY PROTEIN: extracellular calcium-sensing receptor-like [Hemitrygon akajei]|uniref:LOW QUALITY PROTEIN: extracellular calcium-sensing receptor-like n=1 Tax=Hemitrygon akajei TaxID=2704970 RepID=UPI003BF99F98
MLGVRLRRPELLHCVGKNIFGCQLILVVDVNSWTTAIVTDPCSMAMSPLLFLFFLGAVPEMHGIVCKLRTKASLPDLSKDGDVILGGIFTIHLDVINDFHLFTSIPKNTVCRSFGFAFFRRAQTMIFAIEEINQNENLLPGITLGYHIHDDCSSPAIASKAAFALINGEEESIEYTECGGSSNVAAIVGCGPSTNSIVTARTIGSFGIPLVSYSSTCSCLSDKREYPTFFRTSPSDQYQSKILAELVKTFGWTWIGTIRSDTDYGIFGMQGFVKHVENLGVCIAYSESFYRSDPPEKISKIVQVIKEASTKVVVAFAHAAEMRILLNEMLRENVTGIQWIGSEAWVSGNLLPQEESAIYLAGTIGLATRRTEIDGLRDHLHSVHPSNFPGNILVEEFWETLFTCSFTRGNKTYTGSFMGEVRHCTGNERIEDIESTYLPATMEGSSYHVYKAVYSIAYALHNMLTCVEGHGPFMNNTCAHISNFEPWQLLHYIRTVNFTAKTGETVYFDENGDPVPRYEFVNLQMNLNGTVEIVNVGYYDGSAPPESKLKMQIDDIVWSTGWGNLIPRAVCSEPCLPGTRKVSRKGQPICCFDCAECAAGEISNVTDSTDCIQCPSEYWSNQGNTQCVLKKVEFLSFGEVLGFVLVALAIVGVSFTLGTAVIFYRNRETPVVKANNSELSFLLLFALLLCFICSLAFIGEPTEWSCMLRRTAFGIVFVLCISCILGKTIIVVVAFKATLPNSSMMSCFGPTQQRLGVFVLTFLQSIVCIFWLSLSPPYPLQNMSHYRDIIILECDVGSLTAFYVVSSYIALLSIVCLVLAFLARKLPDSFNDAKYITFSMLIFCAVWITFIPAYVSSPGKYTVAVEVFAIWASSFGLLVCIFAPKCYIILLKPEINTKKHMMTKGTSL